MKTSVPLIVFSDLDGTLLDHSSYDWSEARPALEQLARLKAPVVLASSKTAAEICVLQGEMGLTAFPAIVENGSGVIQGSQPVATSGDYQTLRRKVDGMPPDLRKLFQGFGDMSVESVSQTTGLSREAATRAKARAFSEPGLWSGSEEQKRVFIERLAQAGVTARYGGRFLTLSFGASKADQMARIISAYRPTHTVALGDAPNDIEMIETADFGVIIANPHHPPLPPLAGEQDGRVLRSTASGPSGWNTAILTLLARLNLTAPSHE